MTVELPNYALVLGASGGLGSALVAQFLSDPSIAPEGKAEIIISKQRHGPTGIVQVQFEAKFTRFMDLVQDDRLPDQIY